MTQIESLPAKARCSQLLLLLAKVLLASANVTDDKIHFLDALVESNRLSSADRGMVIQSIVKNISSKHGKGHNAIKSWLKSWAESHAKEFKDAVTPILDTLESQQVDVLEDLTQTSLKVFI